MCSIQQDIRVWKLVYESSSMNPQSTAAIRAPVYYNEMHRSNAICIQRVSRLLYNSQPFLTRRVPGGYPSQRCRHGVRQLSTQESANLGVPATHEVKPKAESNDVASAIANATFSFDGIPHLFELNSVQIAEYTNISDLETFVSQIEEAPSLSQKEMNIWALPLSRITSMKTYGKKGAQLTERILWNCLKRLPKHPDDRTEHHPIPPNNLYNRAMIAWGNVGGHHDRVETIFQWQVAEFKNDSRHPPPERTSYKSRIRAWAQHEPSTAYKILREEMEVLSGVPELLKEDVAVADRPYQTELPDLATYNVVAMAYAKGVSLRHPIALQRIMEIYERVRRLEVATGRTGEYLLDGHSYLAILLAHRKYMSATEGNVKIVADVRSWLDEIYDRINAPATAESLSKEAKRGLDGHEQPKARNPDQPLFPLSMAWSYGCLVEAILRSKEPDCLDRAEAVVFDMLKGSAERKIHKSVPQQDTIVRLANAISNTPDSEDRVQRLLEVTVVDRKYGKTFELNEAMDKWASLPAPHQPYVPKLLETILAKALSSYGGKNNKPTGQSFLVAMKSWLRCTQDDTAPSRMEQLFIYMVKLAESPDPWYRPKEVHVRMLFTAYITRCRTGMTYTSAGMTALPSDHCERILTWVTSKSWITKNRFAGYCGMTLRAIAMQEGADELERLDQCLHLLDRFFSGAEIPSYPLNWVLTTCARDVKTAEAKDKAYRTASALFMRKDTKLNHRSYELMVDVVNKQYHNNMSGDDDARIAIVMELFQKACTEGLLSQNMVRQFVLTVKNPDVIQKVFGVDYTYAQMLVQYSIGDYLRLPKPLTVQNLPPEWSVNVRQPQEDEHFT